jgi:hypothetical protein
MIGISMALTIALCVAGFSVIYAALDDTIGDFVSRDVPEPVVRSTEAAPEEDESNAQAQVDPPATEEGEEPVATTPPEVEPTAEPEATEPPNSDAFTPDYQSSFEANLNFRSEPSTTGGESTVIQTLPAGTLLQSTGESQTSDNPAVDGEGGWLEFRLEDGTEGWLRAIDVTEYDAP